MSVERFFAVTTKTMSETETETGGDVDAGEQEREASVGRDESGDTAQPRSMTVKSRSVRRSVWNGSLTEVVNRRFGGHQ